MNFILDEEAEKKCVKRKFFTQSLLSFVKNPDKGSNDVIKKN